MYKIKCIKCGKKTDKKQGMSFRCIYCNGIEYKIIK